MSEEKEHVTVTKEVRSSKKGRPLDSFETFETKEEEKTMPEETKKVSPKSEQPSEGGVAFPGTKEDVEKALAPMEKGEPLPDVEMSIDEAQLNRSFALARILSGVVQQRLDRGIHYDVIPGTQGETLLDAGTSTLMNVARCRPRHRVIEIREEEDGHLVLIMGVDLIYTPAEVAMPNGLVVASGVGAASTHETKYAYRWVLEYDLPDGIDKATLKQRTRGRDVVYRIQNPDLGDLWNTLVKMAAKRAESDAAQHLPGVAEGLARIRKGSKGASS